MFRSLPPSVRGSQTYNNFFPDSAKEEGLTMSIHRSNPYLRTILLRKHRCRSARRHDDSEVLRLPDGSLLFFLSNNLVPTLQTLKSTKGCADKKKLAYRHFKFAAALSMLYSASPQHGVPSKNSQLNDHAPRFGAYRQDTLLGTFQLYHSRIGAASVTRKWSVDNCSVKQTY